MASNAVALKPSANPIQAHDCAVLTKPIIVPDFSCNSLLCRLDRFEARVQVSLNTLSIRPPVLRLGNSVDKLFPRIKN